LVKVSTWVQPSTSRLSLTSLQLRTCLAQVQILEAECVMLPNPVPFLHDQVIPQSLGSSTIRNRYWTSPGLRCQHILWRCLVKVLCQLFLASHCYPRKGIFDWCASICLVSWLILDWPSIALQAYNQASLCWLDAKWCRVLSSHNPSIVNNLFNSFLHIYHSNSHSHSQCSSLQAPRVELCCTTYLIKSMHTLETYLVHSRHYWAPSCSWSHFPLLQPYMHQLIVIHLSQ
jgi:hypothetical protein